MKSFRLSINHRGKHFNGEVFPLHDSGIQGIPLSYKVELEGKNYGIIHCGKDKWVSAEIEDQSLVNAIGSYIHAWYE